VSSAGVATEEADAKGKKKEGREKKGVADFTFRKYVSVK